jgi:hypothetical protein
MLNSLHFLRLLIRVRQYSVLLLVRGSGHFFLLLARGMLDTFLLPARVGWHALLLWVTICRQD